jgi:hypothetical protein
LKCRLRLKRNHRNNQEANAQLVAAEAAAARTEGKAVVSLEKKDPRERGSHRKIEERLRLERASQEREELIESQEVDSIDSRG